MIHYKVGYFVGSLSASSINRLLAKALVRLAPTGIEVTAEFLRNDIIEFHAFIMRVYTVLPRNA